jgi:hypothetical protein
MLVRTSGSDPFFLNVDLDLKGARQDLVRVITGLSNGAHVIYSTSGFAILELDEVELGRAPASRISRFLDLIEALDGVSRKSWNRLSARRVNLGFQSASRPNSLQYSVPRVLLNRLAEANAALVVTLYGRVRL